MPISSFSIRKKPISSLAILPTIFLLRPLIKSAKKHGYFQFASGEMSKTNFTEFLSSVFWTHIFPIPKKRKPHEGNLTRKTSLVAKANP
jgi:hypothetical protein